MNGFESNAPTRILSKEIKVPGPDHPIGITLAEGEVRVIVADAVIAKSFRALRLEEKGYRLDEYSLSRSLSPTLIAQYETQLPDKKLLQAKLHEFYLQNAIESKPRLGKRPLRTKKL